MVFKLTCNLALEQLRNGSNPVFVNFIRYVNCEPCFITNYPISPSSQIILEDTMFMVAKQSNQNGLSPFNLSYKDAYTR